MTQLTALLDLQGKDTALDQLRHRRATLAQRAELDKLVQQISALDVRIDAVASERTALVREQKGIEDEVSNIEQKAAAEDKKLYSGSVTAVKELQALQDEIAALQRRQSTLEDAVLELMERVEPLDEQIAALSAERRHLEQRADELRVEISAAEHEIDAEIDAIGAARVEQAAEVPPALLAEYESLRSSRGGIAVAKLEAGSCRGCHLHLSAVEVDRIRKLPPDAIVHCEECGRLLAR